MASWCSREFPMQLYQKIWQGTSSAFSQSENHGWHHQPFINDVMSSMTKMMMRTCDHSWTWQSLWLATMTWHTTILHTLFSYDIQNLHTSKSSWQTGMWIRAVAAHQHPLTISTQTPAASSSTTSKTSLSAEDISANKTCLTSLTGTSSGSLNRPTTRRCK